MLACDGLRTRITITVPAMAQPERSMTRIVRTDERGALTLPADALGETRPHLAYVVETYVDCVVLRPESRESPVKSLSWSDWLAEMPGLAEEISGKWPEGVDAASQVSEMRR
jgi:hypothetical protein